MARAAKIYDFTLTAGGAFTLLAEGSYYRIFSSTGAVEVRRDGGSGLGPILAGQGERDEFKRLTIIDRSGLPNVGYIVVGDDTFIDDRVTGEVSVIDGELARTKAGFAFECIAATGAVVGQQCYLELWNPPASGRRVIVTDVMFSCSLNAQYGLFRETVSISAASIPLSKASVAGVPVSRFGSGAAASFVVAAGLEAALVAAYVPLIRKFTQPFTLEPGYGLVVVNQQVNAVLYAAMQFIEEAV